MLQTFNNLAKQIIFGLLLVGLVFPAFALAFVTTSGLPFSATNVLPGTTLAGSIAVENTTGSTQTAGIQIFDPAGDFALFATEMTYNVAGDFVTTGDMGELLDVLTLGDVTDGATGNFEFSLTLNNDAPQDPLMGKSFGFTLCVGFIGSEPVCGAAFVPPSSGGGGGGSSGGGGGSSSGTIINLEISNEDAFPLGTDFATITWDTNLPATSQVVYGLASAGPYVLDEGNTPNLGYPQGTTETNTNVEDHEVDLTGLVAGETYLYRVVSTRGSNTEVSPELTFTLLSSEELLSGGLSTSLPAGLILGDTTSENNSFGTSDNNPDGIVLGEADDVSMATETERVAGSVLGDVTENNLAGILNDETSCILLFLVVILLIWFVWSLVDDFILHRNNDVSRKLLLQNMAFIGVMALVLVFLNNLLNWYGMLFLLIVTIFWIVSDHLKHGVRLMEWSPRNRHLYFVSAFALAALVSYFIGHSCLIIPLLVATVIQIVWAAVEL